LKIVGIVTQGSNTPVLWAISEISDLAPLEGKNQILEVGVRGPDPLSRHP